MTRIIAHFRRFNPVDPRLSCRLISVDWRLIKMDSRSHYRGRRVCGRSSRPLEVSRAEPTDPSWLSAQL